VITATVALNVLLAAWALLALLLDGLETRGFFLLEILPLDASLVVTARFSFVPRQIAVDAGFCAALIAGADVVSSFALLYFRQRSPLRSQVAEAFSDLRRWFVDLTGSAAWRQAPPPTWSLVCDASPL
jgi:hypothetical protein